jgi:lysophospholipase L1-like esterase
MTTAMMSAPPASLPRAVFLGDSQGEGLAPHLRTALADLFYLAGSSWQRGISTRAMIRSGKVEAALAQHPAVVVLALGGNDTANDGYRQTLIDMVGLAARDGAHVVWIGPAHASDPEVEARHAAAREVQRAVLPALGVLWLDSVPWTLAGHSDDGVHFTRDAYARQAAEIAAQLRARRDELEGGSSGVNRWLVIGAVASLTAALGFGIWASRRA